MNDHPVAMWAGSSSRSPRASRSDSAKVPPHRSLRWSASISCTTRAVVDGRHARDDARGAQRHKCACKAEQLVRPGWREHCRVAAGQDQAVRRASQPLRIAARADDQFGMLVASGIAIWFAVQSFINIGMTVGIMPVTGLPLPFVPYGGSAMFAT
jgi:hypothetical protein